MIVSGTSVLENDVGFGLNEKVVIELPLGLKPRWGFWVGAGGRRIRYCALRIHIFWATCKSRKHKLHWKWSWQTGPVGCASGWFPNAYANPYPSLVLQIWEVVILLSREMLGWMPLLSKMPIQRGKKCVRSAASFLALPDHWSAIFQIRKFQSDPQLSQPCRSFQPNHFDKAKAEHADPSCVSYAVQNIRYYSETYTSMYSRYS